MAIDLRYIASADLWEVFTDKDTSDFLFNGYVLFFQDDQRTVGKPVYMITGSPPNYTFIEYGAFDIDGAWRVDLNAQGAFDSAVYYFPFDTDGNVQLYFVQWYSADGVLQNSREAWPPDVAGSSNTGTVIDVNYIPNPQFLFNNTNPAVPPNVLGQITAAVTDIAPGWTFQRPGGSTATDIVTFFTFNSPITSPPDNPRYGVQISNTNPDPADTFKYLQVTYDNVNTFASATNQFTFSFYAANTSGSSNVELVLLKNFGSGGSAATQQTLVTFALTSPSYTQFTHTFNFGLNTGQTIGPNNDDFVALALNFPTSSAFSPIILTDFLLAPGTVTNPILPDLPEYISTYQAVAGGLPVAPTDGTYIGLPIIYTATGLNYDFTQVGKVFSTFAATAGFGELLCDGTAYDSLGVSSDGIPYSRLASVLWNPTDLVYTTGSGASFFAAADLTTTNAFTIVPNTPGTTPDTVNGGIASGVIFVNTNDPSTNPVLPAFAYYANDNGFFIRNDDVGLPVTIVTAAQSGYDPGTAGFSGIIIAQGDGSAQTVFVTANAPAGLGGTYFGFATPTGAYYVWFTVDGVGANPAPAGFISGILVPLSSTYSANDVARYCVNVMAGRHITNMVAVAGASIVAGGSINIDTPTQGYYFWFTVNGIGTDPAPVGRIGVVIPVLSTDTAAQVEVKMITAINQRFFATPYLLGYFLRGNDPNATVDLGADFRFAGNNVRGGAQIGSYEFSTNENHTHPNDYAGGQSGADFDAVTRSSTPHSSAPAYGVNSAGIYESRPTNISVNYIIKY